jgi:radical SAM superfamily enzyme YgiQ (UPF0313 family)
MEKKKIILISPNPSFPGTGVWPHKLFSLPLNIMSLVPLLEKNGFATRMIDTRAQDYKHAEYEDALFVGISAQTGVQIKNGLEVARFIRGRYPSIPIVWGGIHPSLLPEETARHPLVDIVCRGEGEETVVELARALSNGGNIGKVLGLTFKSANGEILNTPSRPLIDMDSLGHLPFEKLDMKRYGQKVEMFTSRGCPNKCIFCYSLAYHHSRWRAKSAEKVIDDMEHAAGTVNPPGLVYFCDDNFFVNQRRVAEICEGKIRKNIGFAWTAFCRADYFRKYDKDFLELLARSGCSVIDFGGESGSDRMLERISKGISRDDIMNAAKKCDSVGILARFSFIFGFPEETRKDREATLSLIDNLISECKGFRIYGIYILTPYPGTPIYEEALRAGFNSPKSLDEWGEYKFACFENSPWHNEAGTNYLKTISRLTRVNFYPQAQGHPSPRVWKNIVYDLLSIDARIRWKLKFFSFPFEWLLYDFYCRKRHKY